MTGEISGKLMSMMASADLVVGNVDMVENVPSSASNIISLIDFLTCMPVSVSNCLNFSEIY